VPGQKLTQRCRTAEDEPLLPSIHVRLELVNGYFVFYKNDGVVVSRT
jgi:hypothetical protein